MKKVTMTKIFDDRPKGEASSEESEPGSNRNVAQRPERHSEGDRPERQKHFHRHEGRQLHPPVSE